MRASCAQCGKGFEAQRASKKYCSSSCRGKASHLRTAGGGADVVEIGAPAARRKRSASSKDKAVDEGPREDPFVAAVIAELERAKKLEHPGGQHVVLVARRLVGATRDSASGVAALSKELDRLRTTLLKDVAEEPDELDETQARVLQMRSRRRA